MSLIEKHRRKGPNGKAVIDFDPASNKLLTSSKDIELAMRLFKLVDEHRNSYFLLLKREENRDLREWIDLKTPKLNEGDFSYNYCTKSYWILAGLQDFPKCQNPSCSNLLGVHKNCGYLGYSDHCSHRCKTADEKV